MQILLNQAEINAAVSAFISDTVTIPEGQVISVSFKAVRGSDDVVNAIIDILPEGDIAPFVADEPQPEPAAAEKPKQTRKPRELKHVPVPDPEPTPEPEAEQATQCDAQQEPTEVLKEKATEVAQAAEPDVASEAAEVAEQVAEKEPEVQAKPSLFGHLKNKG